MIHLDLISLRGSGVVACALDGCGGSAHQRLPGLDDAQGHTNIWCKFKVGLPNWHFKLNRGGRGEYSSGLIILERK